MKTSAKAGQGRRTSPPEPSQNPRGPLLAGLSLNMTSSRDARGTKSSISKDDALNHKHVRGAGRASISGKIRHLSSKHHPPLASPFLGPNPVFEIKPQGLGLRASPCRFQAGDGTFGAVPADEIDGDEVVIVSEYDPFA